MAAAFCGEDQCFERARAFNPCPISNSRLTARPLLSGSKHLADSLKSGISEA
jgi:hypothetical protein